MSKADKYSISKIPLKVFLIYFGFLTVLIALGVASIFPFLSERKFRDAFYFGIYKRHKYAIEDMKKAIEYSPWESYYMVTLGRDYQTYYYSLKNKQKQLQLLAELESVYQTTLYYDKYNPWVYLYLANVYSLFKTHQPEKGNYYDLKIDESYQKMVEIGFLNPLFVMNYAIYLHKTKKELDKAKVFYERVISYDNSMGDAYYGLSNIYVQKKEYDKATHILEDLYEVNPRYRGIVVTLSNIYLQQERFNECEEILLAEQEIQPNQELILQDLVKLYYVQSRFDDAVKYLDSLYQFFPKQEPKMFYSYIDALHKSQRYKQAYSLLLGYLLKYPDDSFAEAWLKKIKESL